MPDAQPIQHINNIIDTHMQRHKQHEEFTFTIAGTAVLDLDALKPWVSGDPLLWRLLCALSKALFPTTPTEGLPPTFDVDVDITRGRTGIDHWRVPVADRKPVAHIHVRVHHSAIPKSVGRWLELLLCSTMRFEDLRHLEPTFVADEMEKRYIRDRLELQEARAWRSAFAIYLPGTAATMQHIGDVCPETMPYCTRVVDAEEKRGSDLAWGTFMTYSKVMKGGSVVFGEFPFNHDCPLWVIEAPSTPTDPWIRLIWDGIETVAPLNDIIGRSEAAKQAERDRIEAARVHAEEQQRAAEEARARADREEAGLQQPTWCPMTDAAWKRTLTKHGWSCYINVEFRGCMLPTDDRAQLEAYVSHLARETSGKLRTCDVKSIVLVQDEAVAVAKMNRVPLPKGVRSVTDVEVRSVHTTTKRRVRKPSSDIMERWREDAEEKALMERYYPDR